MRYLQYTAALALLIASACPVWADGLIRDGVGTTASGRGGVNLGYADNGAVILDNPAAMSNVGGTGLLDIGVDTVICSLQYTDPENASADSLNGYPLPSIGYIYRDPDSPWSYGLGVFAPAGFGSGYDMINSDVGGPTFYKSFGALAKVVPSVACQVTDRLSIGASIGMGISHVELEGPFTIQTGPFATADTVLDLQGTDIAPVGNIGLQYLLTPNTVLGLAYTEESRFIMDGNASADLVVAPGVTLPSRFDATFDIVWPRSIGAGVMHDFGNSNVGFDVLWYDWSHAFNELPLTLRNPTNPVVGGLLGSQYTDTLPMSWRDTYSFRSGYEWTPSDVFKARAGYVYHRSPVPEGTLNPYLDGILEHAVSVGVSRMVAGAWLNAAYQYSWSPTRTVGTSNIVGGDFSNSTLRAEAHWIGLSVVKPY